jgi:glycosyltransferase involved in cell wall biosynthesis
MRRARRTWGWTPRYARPSDADLQREGGAIHQLVAGAWTAMQHESASSIERALAERADVLWAHDPAAAEELLRRRAKGQQVWLFLHAPMPHALYLAWCWAVPERAWEEVLAYPDVQSWTAREHRVIDEVDRVWLPCREAAGEWVRIHAGFADALQRASFLLTGASLDAPSDTRTAADLRRRWHLPAGVPVALFLGNAQPYRGLDLLLRSLDRLPSTGEVPGVVAVAGVERDALPLHRRLRALGRVADVGALLQAVDVVLNVNRFSLFDLSTIEALEAGRPLLLSPVGGNRAFSALGAGCLLLDALTEDAIARGLEVFFTMSDDERGGLQRRSRACYEAHLTPRHLRDRHLAAYDASRAWTHTA